MSIFKSKDRITELQAVAAIVGHVREKANDEISDIYNELRSIHGTDLEFADLDVAAQHLTLAALGQELEAIRNLLTDNQATRLATWIFKVVEGEYDQDAADEVAIYAGAFDRAIQHGENPIGAIPALLLSNWLGDGLSRFEDETQGFISPTLLLTTGTILIAFAGSAKRLVEAFKLVPVG